MPVKRMYLVNPLTKKKYRMNGLQPSTKIPQVKNLEVDVSPSMASEKGNNHPQLPLGVDMRAFMSPVQDQSGIASCSANAIAGAYEYLLRRSKGSNDEVSRLFIYFNARSRRKPKVMSDSGCTMTQAIEALAESGACHEVMWPYDTEQVDQRPADQVYEEAKDHRITRALKLRHDLNEMKSCLAQGFPFGFGLRLYQSFDRGGRSGRVPMPKPNEPSRGRHAVHAMLAVGYSDPQKRFIVRNSWGPDWGDNGYCYIPYDYLMNTTDCFDIWTVRAVNMNDFNNQHWKENEEEQPVVDTEDEETDNDDPQFEEVEEDGEEEEEVEAESESQEQSSEEEGEQSSIE